MSTFSHGQNLDNIKGFDDSECRIKPFLKWPGGKRWFVQRYSQLLPNFTGRYYEPFLGGGAVYLHLRPPGAFLSDINVDVIEVYNAVKCSWKNIESELKYHQRHHSHDHYYAVRKAIPTDPIERAARILYLNRTCFNGIYRVNLNGKFNVPKGTKNSVILPEDNFKGISHLLSSADIVQCDFDEAISQCRNGDFVFADPPYTVRHNNNGFIKYNENLFSWSDQQRLSQSLTEAHLRGVCILCTNADHDSVRGLYYPGLFEVKTTSRFSSISASSESRKHFNELLILSRRT